MEETETNQDKRREDNDSEELSSSSSELSRRSTSSSSNNISSLKGSSQDVGSIELTIDEQPHDRAPSSTVHGHILPAGWMCNYDTDTDQYKFEYEPSTSRENQDKPTMKDLIVTKDEAITAKTPTADHVVQTSRRPTLNAYECQFGYHFPSSPTSSMISELAKQVQKSTGAPPTAPKTKQVGYGKRKLVVLSDEEEQAKRLREMFPTAPAQVTDQMIRIYHGREGLIKAALISLGYKRATEYDAQKATAQSPIMLMMSKASSKKLFDKLVSYFPDKDESLIKNLMYKYKEVEHEIISDLVEQTGDNTGNSDDDLTRRNERVRMEKNGAIMKLRYLKFLFPSCEEIELYHLLHCNDLNAQKVIEIAEKRGHKKANIDEVLENRKSQTQQLRAQQAAHAAKEKAPKVDVVETHRTRTKPAVNENRTKALLEGLKKKLNSEERVFADGLILAALEATDYNEPLARKFLEEMPPIDEAKYRVCQEFKRDKGPNVVLYPSKGVQKCNAGSFMSVTCDEYVSIAREVVECTNALALLKVDACTCTQDDFITIRHTLAKGKQLGLAMGSVYVPHSPETTVSLRQGSNETLRCGSNYDRLLEQKACQRRLAKGRSETLSSGRNEKLAFGHNPRLIQRTHPFFLEQQQQPQRQSSRKQADDHDDIRQTAIKRALDVGA